MALFSKPEVVILKESSDAKIYLEKLEAIFPSATGDQKEQIEKEISATKAGIYGENNLLFELKNSGMDMVVLHDIYIETPDGRGAQIDFIVLTSKLTFIIECKNLYGDIEINSKGDFIRTVRYGKKVYKEGIYSPITQNQRHMTVLKDCILSDKNFLEGLATKTFFEKWYKSLVVLANPKTVVNDKYAPQEVKDQVIRVDQLINVIRQIQANSKEIPLSHKEVLEAGKRLLSRNRENRSDYVAKYQELIDVVEKEQNPEVLELVNLDTAEPVETVQNKEETKVDREHVEQSGAQCENIFCPRCGSKLVLRVAKKGDNAGNQFYGCSGFPKCRYIQNL